MKQKKIVLYIFVVLVTIAAIGAWYFYKEYNRTLKDTSLLTPDYSLPATSLIEEFIVNDSIAGKKYLDKIIRLEGIVKEILKDEAGFNTIILGNTSAMSSVRCSMDSIHNKEADQLRKGSHAAVKGICVGFNASDLLGSDVIMVRCLVEQ